MAARNEQGPPVIDPTLQTLFMAKSSPSSNVLTSIVTSGTTCV